MYHMRQNYQFHIIRNCSKKSIKIGELLYDNFIGWDTETIFGSVYLIGYYDLANKKYVHEWYDISEINTSQNVTQLLNLLSKHKYMDDFNCFFNVKYDFQSIMRNLTKTPIGLKTYDDMNDYTIELYEELIKGMTFINNNMISHYDFKCFNINDYSYYDLYPFVKTKLKIALEEYKLTQKQDLKLHWWDWDWILKHKSKIISYHKDDCKGLAELAKIMHDKFENCGIEFKNPISVGKIIAQHINKNTPRYKNYELRTYKRLIFAAYKGALIDMYKKGSFKHVWSYDINSAYPSTIANLISMQDCRFIQLIEFDDNYDYGYWACDVDFRQPFKPIKISGVNVFHTGFHRNIFLSKNEIEFILKLGWKIEIKEGLGIKCYCKNKPYKKLFEKAYKDRQKFKALPKGDPNRKLEQVFKTMLASAYGKIKQDMPHNKLIARFNQSTEIELFKQTCAELDSKDTDYYIKQYIDGQIGIFVSDFLNSPIFNPAYATQITSDCRLRLLKLAYKYPDNVIKLSTDSITLNRKIPIKTGKRLGEFSIEIDNFSGCFIGNGIYFYEKGDKYIEARRGMFKFDDTKEVLQRKNRIKDLLKTEEDYYIFERMKMLHMKECFRSHELNMINCSRIQIREQSINPDKLKRDWNENFKSGFEALEKNISSKPFKIKDSSKNWQFIDDFI